MATKRIQLEKFVTPEGVAVYPRFRKPDTKFNAAGVYSTRIRLTAEEAAPFMERIDAVATEKFNTVKAELLAGDGKSKAKAKNLKYAADKPYRMSVDEDGNETGDVEFNVKMTASGVREDGTTWARKPLLFDAGGKKQLPTTVDVWGGSRIIVAGEYNPFYTAIGVGVGLRLVAVQVIELVAGGERDGASFGFGAQSGYEAPDEVEAPTMPKADDGDSSDADDQF